MANIDGKSETMFLILSSFQVDAKEEILETVSKLVRHQADGVPHIQVDQLEGGGVEHFPGFSLTRVLDAWSFIRPQPSPQ